MKYLEPEMGIVTFDNGVFTDDLTGMSSTDNTGGNDGGSTVFPTMQTELSDI